MEIRRIIWVDDIVEKLIVKHRVGQQEVREILGKRPRFRFVENGFQEGENLYAAMGQTEAGRLLIVFFIHKNNRGALVVTARDMTDAERKRYEKK